MSSLYYKNINLEHRIPHGQFDSLQECLRCIINGEDNKYINWSTDIKLLPPAAICISQVTTTLGLSSYEIVFNQKPRKLIIFTANFPKKAQSYWLKDSVCYNVPLHAHDEELFQHPQVLKLAIGTHTEWIFNQERKHKENYEKIAKIFVTKTKHSISNKSNLKIYTSIKPKSRNVYLISILIIPKRIWKTTTFFENDSFK